jgi:hypothetical protein
MQAQLTVYKTTFNAITDNLNTDLTAVIDGLISVANNGNDDRHLAISVPCLSRLATALEECQQILKASVGHISRSLSNSSIAIYNSSRVPSYATMVDQDSTRASAQRRLATVASPGVSRKRKLQRTESFLAFLLSLNQDTLILIHDAPGVDRRDPDSLINNGSRNIRRRNWDLSTTADESRDKHPFYLPRLGRQADGNLGEASFTVCAPDRKLMLPRVGSRDPSAEWLPVDRLVDSSHLKLQFPSAPTRPRHCSGGGDQSDHSSANGEFAVYLGTTSHHSHLQNQLPTFVIWETQDVDFIDLLAALDGHRLPIYSDQDPRHLGNYTGHAFRQTNAALSTIVNYISDLAIKSNRGAVNDIGAVISNCLVTARAAPVLVAQSQYPQSADYESTRPGQDLPLEEIEHGYSFCKGTPTYLSRLADDVYRIIPNGLAIDSNFHLRDCFAINTFEIRLTSPCNVVFHATVHRPEDVNDWLKRESVDIFLG